MKIGLIGIDSTKNENHFLQLNDALENNLFGIFSPHYEEVLPISKEYNVKLYTTANELCQHADAIYFAGTLKPNYDFALNAIKKSCHLFIENIPTLSVDEIKYLYKVAFEAGTYIQLKLTKSFLPEYLNVKDRIQNPKLIEFNDSYASLIRKDEYFNIITNNLNLTTQFINAEIKKISTLALPVDKNHFSLVNVRIDYDNGVIANLKIESITSENKNTACFYETNQVHTIDFNKHYAIEHRLEQGHVKRHESDVVEKNPLKTELHNFIDFCHNLNTQNISESPEVIKIIKATQSITEELSKINNHN